MRRLLLLTLTLTAGGLMAAPGSASAAVCNFQGPGAAWHDAANWDCLVIPGAADTAVVGSGDNVTVDQAESVAALTLGGGQITFSGDPTLAVSGSTSMTGGTLTGNGNVAVAATGSFSKTTAGTLTVQNGADLVLNVDASLDGGAVCLFDLGGGDPSLVINQQLEITANAAQTVFNCNAGLDSAAIKISATGELLKDFVGATSIVTPVDNDGQFNVLAGSMSLSGGTAGATWSGSHTTANAATTTFASAHTLTSTGVITGAGHTIIADSVTIPDGGSLTATTLTHSAGTLSLAGASPALAPVTYNLSGGTLSSSRALQPTSALNVTSGTLTGNFTTTIDSPATFAKTTAGTLTVQNGADLVLNVDASLDGGAVCLFDLGGGDPSLVINQQLEITANAAQTVFNCNAGLDSAAIKISATGELLKDFVGATSIVTPVDNDGQFNVLAGSMSLSGGTAGATWSGSHTTANAATTTFASAHTLTSTGVITGAGHTIIAASVTIPDGGSLTATTLTHSAGTLSLAGASPALAPVTYNLSGGTLSSSRALQPTSALNVTSGTLTGNFTTTIDSPATFAKTTAGTLTVQNGADLVLNVDASLDGGAVCLFDLGGGDPSLVINQQLEITANAAQTVFNCNAGLDSAAIKISATGELLKDFVGATSIVTPVDNDGQFNVLAGSMSLSGGTAGATWSGSHTTANAATTTFASAHTLTSTGVITGAGHTIIADSVTIPDGGSLTATTLTHSAGTLSLAGASPALAPVTYNLSGGTLSSSRALQPTSALNVTSGTLTGNFTTTIDSPATFAKTTAGTLTVQNGADLVLNVDASLDGGAVCLFDLGGGDPSLVINQQLEITANAAQTVFNCNAGLDSAAIKISATGELLKDFVGATSIVTPVDNDGQFNVLAGSMSLSGGTAGATWSGSHTTANAATTTFASAHTLTSTGVITGAGHTIIADSVTIPDGGSLTATTLTHSAGTLSLAGASPALAPVTYNLSGGTLSSSRALQPTSALNVTSGTLTGNFTTTIDSPATFAKTTAGTLTVQNGADLVLNVDASLDGGAVCLFDLGGGDPSLVINQQLEITANAAQTVFNCNAGLDSAAIKISGPDGRLLRSGAGSNSIVTPLRVAGGTLSVGGGQTINVVGGFEQTGGLTEIAAGGTLGGGIVAAISGGVFRVDGSYSGTPTFTGTGVLSGNGTVTGTVTNTSGTVRPGTSPGTLTITVNYNQGPGGTLEIDLTGTIPGSGFDVLTVSGNANLNGTLKAIHGGGFDPATSDVFAFMTSGSSAGQFATLDAPALGGGKAYQLDYPGAPSFGARLLLQPPTPPGNQVPPTITGNVAVGETLTCNPGTWTFSPTFEFQWLRDNQPIEGASGSTYAPTGDDAARQIACRVTATNPSGSAQATTSAVNVPAATPQNMTPPSLTGTPTIGATLTCATGTWSGAPTPSIEVQWLRDGQPVAGANQATYAVGAADVTSSLACRVTATNVGGSVNATTAAVGVAAVAPQNVTRPAISGSAEPGSTLTCALGSWAGIPSPSFRVQWLRDAGEIPGATAATYALASADAGNSITCRVTATNAGGSTAATSAEFNTAKPVKPAEQVLAEKSREQVAAAIGLPSARRCISRRKFPIRLRQPKGVRIRSVKVIVRGKRVKTRKIKGRYRATVNLRGLSKGRFTVRITITTSSKRKIVAQRRYRTCIPRRKSKTKARRSAVAPQGSIAQAGAPAQ